eukprot:SAG11_NODE_411_length_9696_cov_46.841513_4_plen_96_part_00
MELVIEASAMASSAALLATRGLSITTGAVLGATEIESFRSIPERTPDPKPELEPEEEEDAPLEDEGGAAAPRLDGVKAGVCCFATIWLICSRMAA